MAYRVHLLEMDQSFTVEDGETVLGAALRANVNLPHDCQFGGCGTCRIKLLKGAVAYEEYPFGLTPEEESEGFALACQARPQSDLLIAPGRATTTLPEPERYTAVVKDIRSLSEGVIHLVLEAALPLVYQPGQYMNVHLKDGSVRSLSMASTPNGTTVDFHVRRVPGGQFTDLQLMQTNAGDMLDIELPLGSFFYRKEDYRPLQMVATGTGLAPIKSILQSLMDNPDCPPVWLYWGMRTEADLYLHQEIEQWRGQLYDFQYIPVLSQPDGKWTGRRGYVQHAIVDDFDDLSEHAIYICGSPAMVRDAKSAFIARAASIDHIYTDSFSFAYQLAEQSIAA
jgi:CDP-4-dehydro-6-deoxyglucose reductase